MNVLAFFAHPDDETMFCGGTLALLARQGATVDYLCATRGEGGEVGEPLLCSLDELGEVRQAEMACAAETLGAHSLAFLDYIDPRIGPNETLFPYSDNPQEVAGKLVDVIRSLRPQALITHGANGEYGHPAHVLCYQAARAAVESLDSLAPSLYSVSGDFPGHPKPRHINQDQRAHMVLDITPVLEKKRAAALCHKTQHALFVRRASERAGRQLTVEEIILEVESLHRAYPKRRPGETLTDPVTAMLAKYSRG